MSFTLLLVEDHPIVRGAYRQQIETAFEEARVLCCGSLTDAFRHLDGPQLPDFAIVDLNLPDACGVATLSAIRDRAPALRVIAMSGELDVGIIQGCRAAGAVGFIPKTYTQDQFATVLRLVLAGGVGFPDCSGRYPSPAAADPDLIRLQRRAGEPAAALPTAVAPAMRAAVGRPPLAPPARPPGLSDGRHLGLTDRQRSVLRLMLQGVSNKAICRELRLAEGTVKVHVSAVLRALGVSTRTQVVIAALRSGIRFEDRR